MKSVSTVLVFVFFAGVWLALQACALLTGPVATTVIGGTQLAIKGAELEKEIRKADVQEAIDASFEKTWNIAVIALVNLDIEITRSERNAQEDGGLIEGLAKKIEVKVVAVKLTEKITEIGIWASHDKALAGLIADKIKGEAQKQAIQATTTNPKTKEPY
jgi:hypothetical protein